ncbi:MAG: glycosyltransferase family 2 protein [Waterburya sp.]
MSQLKTPIVFFVFNRPDVTKIVFEAIRQAKPTVMYVIADGARTNKIGEAGKCEAVHKVIEGVDWDCKVITNYSEINLGCKKRISSGLDWVFEQVESAIILEDDCLPDPSFFRYCDELLEYYHYDSRVMSIGGLNPQLNKKITDYSYYFSRYPHIWGWATWKRAWQFYDVDMKLWSKISNHQFLENIFTEPRTIKYWTQIFQATYQGDIDTWDYQWIFTCLMQGGFSIIPNRNLVSNLGFGIDATHTVNSGNSSPYSNMNTEEMVFPLRHPTFMLRSLPADSFTENNYYNLDMSLKARAIRKISRFF